MKEFKELSQPEQYDIFEFFIENGYVEEYHGYCGEFVKTTSLSIDAPVRIPVTYPEVPWQSIDKKWKYFVVDHNGMYILATHEIFHDTIYRVSSTYPECVLTSANCLNIPKYTCSLKETIVKRPDGE